MESWALSRRLLLGGRLRLGRRLVDSYLNTTSVGLESQNYLMSVLR